MKTYDKTGVSYIKPWRPTRLGWLKEEVRWIALQFDRDFSIQEVGEELGIKHLTKEHRGNITRALRDFAFPCSLLTDGRTQLWRVFPWEVLAFENARDVANALIGDGCITCTTNSLLVTREIMRMPKSKRPMMRPIDKEV